MTLEFTPSLFGTIANQPFREARIILPLVLAVVGMVIPTAAKAKMIDATKTITWSFAAAPVAFQFGQYTWNIVAIADVAPGAVPAAWNGNGNWMLKAGLPNVPKDTGVVGPGPKGSTAEAEIDFTATAPAAAAAGGFTATGTIHSKLQTNLGALAGAWAMAQSGGSLAMQGGNVTGATIENTGGVITVNQVKLANPVTLGGDAAGKGTWHDPISVSFTDLTNGSVISQDLLEMDTQVTGAGEISWGPGGFSLDVPNDGVSSVLFSLDPMSSWITDPNLIDSTLSFSGGIFQATGIFSSLPWVITPGHVTLPGGLLDSLTIPYQVPSGLINATDLYAPSLSITESAQLSEGTPEPAYAFPTAIIVAAFLARARRGP